MKRNEQKVENCWRMEDLYENDELWQGDFSKLEKLLPELSAFEGRLAENSGSLLAFLSLDDKCSILAEKVYVYANQKLHENTSNPVYQNASQRAGTLLVKKQAATAFFSPELLNMGEEKVRQMIDEWEGLRLYQRYLLEFFRQKDHILSNEIEGILANASEVAEGAGNIFSMFNNADIHFEDVIDSDGKQVPLTQGNYTLFLESTNRNIRKDAFTKLYSRYKEFENTLAATFAANVKQAVFFAKARNYKSSLEYKLDDANIPVSVYKELIEAVHESLPLMYRYMNIRKQALKLEKLHMYDLYTPMVKRPDKRYSFEEAKEIVKSGLKPLGEDYLAILQEGFDNRWIDIYENEGKRSGAYSWGAYGIHPYVLMNYQGNLNHVFTLAHEMGHALHSYFSDEANEYVYAGYKIFVAEVASTCNESLLIHHLLSICKEPDEKKYLVNYFLEQFRGTLFRQTMFAEFEMIMHEMVEEGQTLTAESISSVYYELNCKYFGDEVEVDSEIAMEWARIPHFYTPFYVYQYATGFSAAITISRRILAGDKEVLEGYRRFLRSGGSMDPIDLLKLAGVDMASPEPVREAMKLFDDLLTKFEQ